MTRVNLWTATLVTVGLASTLFTFAGCGNGSCSGETPVPTLKSISPTSVSVGVLPVTVTVNGSGFVSWSKVYINGAQAGSVFVNSSKLVATIDSNTVYQGRLAPGMTVPVVVENGGSTVGAFAGNALGCPNGGVSESVMLTLN